MGLIGFTAWKVWEGEKKEASVKTTVSPAPSASPAASGVKNQTDMVVNLKKLLATVELKK